MCFGNYGLGGKEHTKDEGLMDIIISIALVVAAICSMVMLVALTIGMCYGIYKLLTDD